METILEAGGKTDQDLLQLVSFQLGEEEFGVDILKVQEINRMLEITTDITEGRGTPEQLDLLEELADTVSQTALCGLGKTAPNPVLSTVRYFRDEYEAH
ncbi:hypothetical protein LCGC14_2069340, partial [marine sediment metagenome]